MKAFLLWLAVVIHALAGTLLVTSEFEYAKASPYMEYIADKNNTLSFETIHDVAWTPLASTNLGGNNIHYTWTRFTLHNTSTEPKLLILKNPRAGMDEIDVYIIRESGYEHVMLGDNRDLHVRKIPHRYSVFPLRLDQGEQVEITSRLINRIGATDAEWDIYSDTSFTLFSLKESLWWGLFIGFTLSLFFYSVPILIGAKDFKLTLFFSLYVVSSLLYQLSVNGTLYSFGFSAAYINHMTLFFGILFGLFTVLVMLRFLHIIHYQKGRLFHAMYLLIVLFSIEIVCLGLSFFDSAYLRYTAILGVYVGIFGYLLWFALISEFLHLSKDKVFVYLFLGYTAVFGAYIFLALVSAGFIENNIIAIYGVSIGSLIEMYCFSLGISEYIRQIERTKANQNKVIEIQMRFASIGRIIGNIAHQWKVPLVHAGTLLAETEAIIHLKQETLRDKLEERIIPQLRNNLTFMQGTIDEFYELYKGTTQKLIFKPYALVCNVWNMLSAKAIASHVKLEMHIPKELEIESYEHHFAHIVMVLFDNAIDIAKARKCSQAVIICTIKKDDAILKLYVEDNCGGISQEPIESILELDVSSKNNMHEQRGMGLFVLKTLLEIKFLGTLHVSNTENGARFEITIPISSSLTNKS
jgi:two-component system, sensor histidine kinase LadS